MNQRSLIALLALTALPLVALAQKPVSLSDGVEATAKIVAIDVGPRVVTVKLEDGNLTSIFCGPEVQRFDELKVGDTLTFRYYESVVVQVRKPGQAGAPPADGTPQVTRGEGPRPSGTLSRQVTARVTVKAVDLKAPSLTVATEDGQVSSYKIEDKSRVKDLKPGDVVELTYTQALMITVK